MGKLEFLDALKRAMTGLAPEAQAKTLAFYEQRFVDGVAAGSTEEDVAKELDDPKKIAMTLRASTHMQAFENRKNPANFVRMAFAALGLAIFNLFMVVPAMVYAALLATLYACGLAFYLGGTVVTASGLSGANEIKLDGPLRTFLVEHQLYDDKDGQQMKVNIGENGIEVFSERDADAAPEVVSDEDEDKADKRSVRAIKRAESVASEGVLFSTDTEDGSRATQTAFGLFLVLGGIVLLLISLVVTRYTFIGLKRYIEMNFSLLKGH
ncbi:MAG: DUF1700 domain-containing protein [Pseudomonadota bacterium]